MWPEIAHSIFWALSIWLGALKQLGLLGQRELVSLLDAGGGSLGRLVRTAVDQSSAVLLSA